MLQTLETVPPDAILGLIAEHKADPRDNKIDLGVGVYMTPEGKTPVLDVVKEAERHLVDTQDSKAYIGTFGLEAFNIAMQAGTFAGSVGDERLTTLQAPGGSGSLRAAAGLLMRARSGAVVWASDPTWANHVPLLGGAGLELKAYPYYDADQHVLKIDDMLESLRGADAGDLVLLHACCHNPCGLDPTDDDWRRISEVIVERGLIPFIDMAYQGFARDLDSDAFIIRHLADKVPEMLVCNSCSKNFGLYRDRVGSLTVLCENMATRDVVKSNLGKIVRTLWSVPPDHGAAIVARILGDERLTEQWHGELYEMRDRMRDMRALLVDALAAKAPGHDFSHLTRATGMFCFLGVTPEQVELLKKGYGIYMVGSSRINVAGITRDNVEYLAESVAAVLGQS